MWGCRVSRAPGSTWALAFVAIKITPHTSASPASMPSTLDIYDLLCPARYLFNRRTGNPLADAVIGNVIRRRHRDRWVGWRHDLRDHCGVGCHQREQECVKPYSI